jgi:hypothetical protein
VERKAKFIHQVMRGDVTSREIDDISEQTLSYAEMKALATGNPLIMEKAGVDNDVARLVRLRKAHEVDQRNVRWKLEGARDRIDKFSNRAALCAEAIMRRIDTSGDLFTMVVDGVTFTKRGEAGEALRDGLTAIERRGATGATHKVGHLGGFDLEALMDRQWNERAIEVRLAGTPFSKVFKPRDLYGLDAVGVVASFEHAVRGLDKMREDALADRRLAEADERSAAERAGQPFDMEQQLVGLQRRQLELEAKLADMDEDKENAA